MVDMNDLCTIETVGFVLRLVLQKLPGHKFESDFFKLLTGWINNGPLSNERLHQLKLDLIDALGPVVGWVPCKTYVSIGAILTAAFKTLSIAESALFVSTLKVVSHCKCPTTTKLFHQVAVFVEEKLTDSTLSLQAALNHLADYNCQLPINCYDCGIQPVEHRKFN